MLDFVEEALDEVALTVEGKVAQALYDPVGFWWDDDTSAAFFDAGYDSVAVISFVRQHVCGDNTFEQ